MATPLIFNSEGYLPPDDYPLTLAELRDSILVAGPPDKLRYPKWDIQWRTHLVDNLAILVEQLWQVGITDIFIDGSFTEDKEHPNDIDGYFVCDLRQFISGELERKLNRLDPHKIWAWNDGSRRKSPGFPYRQLLMWHQYRVELYPHTSGASSGLRDAFGNELGFPEAFRLSKKSRSPRGIVKVIR